MPRTYFSILLSIVLFFAISFRTAYNTFFAKSITTVNYRYNKGISARISHDIGSERFEDIEKVHAKKSVESRLIKGKHYKGILNSSKVKMQSQLISVYLSFHSVFAQERKLVPSYCHSQSTSEKHILISVLRI
jgi:hypothetical protein